MEPVTRKVSAGKKMKSSERIEKIRYYFMVVIEIIFCGLMVVSALVFIYSIIFMFMGPIFWEWFPQKNPFFGIGAGLGGFLLFGSIWKSINSWTGLDY